LPLCEQKNRARAAGPFARPAPYAPLRETLRIPGNCRIFASGNKPGYVHTS